MTIPSIRDPEDNRIHLIEFDRFAFNADAWMQYQCQQTEAIRIQKEQTLVDFLAAERMGTAVSTY